MNYITPADVGVSDNRATHVARGSAEPGTDYKTAYGTDLRAPGDGRVISVDRSPDGPEGRRLTFLMDNGEVIDWIHLDRIMADPNQRIGRAQTGLALSGGSGWGIDRYYASHVHVTRRARLGLPYTQTLDFEDAIGDASPASTTQEEDDMFTQEDRDRMKNIETLLGSEQNATNDPGVGILHTAKAARDKATDALAAINNVEDITSDIRNYITDQTNGIIAKLDEIAAKVGDQ